MCFTKIVIARKLISQKLPRREACEGSRVHWTQVRKYLIVYSIYFNRNHINLIILMS